MKTARRPAKHPLPTVVTDNTAGRPLNAKVVARETAFLMGPDIIKRLQARKAAGGTS